MGSFRSRNTLIRGISDMMNLRTLCPERWILHGGVLLGEARENFSKAVFTHTLHLTKSRALDIGSAPRGYEPGLYHDLYNQETSPQRFFASNYLPLCLCTRSNGAGFRGWRQRYERS